MWLLHWNKFPGQLFLSELTGIKLWSTGANVHALKQARWSPYYSGHILHSEQLSRWVRYTQFRITTISAKKPALFSRKMSFTRKAAEGC